MPFAYKKSKLAFFLAFFISLDIIHKLRTTFKPQNNPAPASMTKQVPFQMVMRAARRILLEEAERAQATGANTPTANVPTVSAPTVNVPNASTMAVMPPILGPATSTPGAPNPAPLVAEDANDYQNHDQNGEEEELVPLIEQGNETGEMMEPMETCASDERDVPAMLPGPTE